MKTANAILGIVRSYNFEQIRPFVESLNKANFTGDVIFFVSKISRKTKIILKKQGIKLVFFNSKYPYINFQDFPDFNNVLPKRYAHDMNLCSMRFVMYYLYLLKHGYKYANIMLTDVRDVIFQKDPFAFDFSNQLCCFLEDESRFLGTCQRNSEWIINVFGKDILSEIRTKHIFCAGTIIGTRDLIIDYLTKMLDILVRIDARGGVDQGIHNYLIYKNQLKNLKIFSNENGPVLTLGSKKVYNLNKDGHFINKMGRVVNIVHQYDRIPELAKKYYSPTVRIKMKFSNINGWVAHKLIKYPKIYSFLKKVKNKL